jgi:hypothetical protein
MLLERIANSQERTAHALEEDSSEEEKKDE